VDSDLFHSCAARWSFDQEYERREAGSFKTTDYESEHRRRWTVGGGRRIDLVELRWLL